MKCIGSLRVVVSVGFLAVAAPSMAQTPSYSVQTDAATLEAASAGGNGAASFYLGYKLANGVGVAKDPARAVALYKLAGERGIREGWFNYGIMVENGVGIAKNLGAATQAFKKSADAGYAKGMAFYADMLRDGLGVIEPDPVNARIWYEKAVTAGYADGNFGLGRLYELGQGVPADRMKSCTYYRAAVTGGGDKAESNSLVSAGLCASNGVGMAADKAEAVRLYKLASDKGDAIGALNLGTMYESGAGVAKDLVQAARLYRLAGDRGSAKGMVYAGDMYLKGWGVAVDYAEAEKWYHRADAKNYDEATRMIGVLYELGNGHPADRAEAIRYYQRAAGMGNAKAKQALTRLGVAVAP